jgi:hypothetical protein
LIHPSSANHFSLRLLSITETVLLSIKTSAGRGSNPAGYIDLG